jgi:hypothetical protein
MTGLESCPTTDALAGLSTAADNQKGASKEDDELPPVAQPDEQAEAVANIAMANRLVDYGLNSEPKSPLALITAASIVRHIKTREGTEKPTTEGGAGDSATPPRTIPRHCARSRTACCSRP